MKFFSIFLLACSLAGCHQQQSAKEDHQTMDMDTRTMSDTAKQLLIDISNSAWFQAQVAEAALPKMHDTSMLSLAQNISKQYTHIKDKAKIVSVPYKLNMPYFLKPDQNARVNELKSIDDPLFTKEFLDQITVTNDIITKQCNDFQSLAIGDSDVIHFINFSKKVVKDTESQLDKIM